MTNDTTPLTDEERAELEQLRAEKAAREEAERARVERAELERLRAERASAYEAAQETQAPTSGQGRPSSAAQQDARQRERNIMEPDDDLSMPLGQKIVLAAVAVAAILAVLVFVFGPK